MNEKKGDKCILPKARSNPLTDFGQQIKSKYKHERRQIFNMLWF